MSTSRMTTVWCDGALLGAECGAHYTADDAKTARRKAKARGWVTGRPGGADYCPTCIRLGVVTTMAVTS